MSYSAPSSPQTNCFQETPQDLLDQLVSISLEQELIRPPNPVPTGRRPQRSTTMPSAAPISDTRLKQIANDACDKVLSTAESYVHSSTETWNSSIINDILKSIISESTPKGATQPPYKYAVNSTIVQHTAPVAGGDPQNAGRRGMHSATGAYWNEEKDGMWSYKYEGGDAKGMDVVVSVFWFGL